MDMGRGGVRKEGERGGSRSDKAMQDEESIDKGAFALRDDMPRVGVNTFAAR